MHIKTRNFGCRLNTLEGEMIQVAADAAGLEDALVVNTCAVTSEAVRQARQAIRKARREAPDKRIIVTGCAVQVAPEAFAAMPEVDAIVGNREKTEPATYHTIARHGARAQVGDIMRPPEKPLAPVALARMGQRVRAFVQIQTGCDHRCTFCIIPFGRGPSRSIPPPLVIDQCRRLVDNGHKEIVLTGVDITAYGADLAPAVRLGDLVGELLTKVPGLRRLRLTSLDSVEVDAALVEMIAGEERLMPHLHLSLQSGDDMILKRMKRRHTRSQAVAFCEQMRQRRPDIVFGADIIAGFPTETAAMFENSLSLVDECGLTFLHVFPFSPRPGTPAARMPQVDGGEITTRARRLRDKGASALRAHLDANIGQMRAILIESANAGHTQHHTRAIVTGGANIPAAPPGTVVQALVTGHDDNRLVAQATG